PAWFRWQRTFTGCCSPRWAILSGAWSSLPCSIGGKLRPARPPERLLTCLFERPLACGQKVNSPCMARIPFCKSRRTEMARTRILTDPEEIRRWAEERGAKPACVRGTGGDGDVGMIRLDFPGYSGAESLEHISWDEWSDK